MRYQIEVVADDRNKCGEAPTWDPRNESLLWVDNESSLVYRLDTRSGAKEIISRDLMVAGIALDRNAGHVFAGATGIHLWFAQDNYRTIAAEYEGTPLYFNDITADPQGRVYGGTLYWNEKGMERYGRLYLVTADGAVRVADEGIELANGLDFSPDERTLYFADSSARKIYAYDVNAATGTLSNRRVLVQVSTDEGIPDGLSVDAQGFIWCAHWYGGEIVRYDPIGHVERRIEVPSKQVSSVIFGGKDLTEMYATSAANSWVGPYAPKGYDFSAPDIGGPLYRIKTDVQGKPPYMAAFG